MQRVEDVCFRLGLHAHHVAQGITKGVAQGQGWKLLAGEGPPAERVGAALARAADGDSHAAPLTRRLVNAPPPGFERVCRLALWAMVGAPEHERGRVSRAFCL